MAYSKNTDAWLERVAKANNTTKEDVVKYIDSLSHGKGVIHHLDLSAGAEG